jgi:hypothetical protein
MQVVQSEALPPSRRRGIRHVLSMGHRIVDLSISHNDMDGKDEICVTIYRAKYASGEDREEVAYHYSVFNKAQERFVPNRQRFSKYGVEYNFNLLDVVICGTQEKEAAEKLRYRRVLFAIVPQEGEEVEVEEVREEKRRGGTRRGRTRSE